MLITKSYHDVSTKLDPNGRPIRIFIIAPNVPGYPNAKFPGTSTSLCSKNTDPQVLAGVVVFRWV